MSTRRHLRLLVLDLRYVAVRTADVIRNLAGAPVGPARDRQPDGVAHVALGEPETVGPVGAERIPQRVLPTPVVHLRGRGRQPDLLRRFHATRAVAEMIGAASSKIADTVKALARAHPGIE